MIPHTQKKKHNAAAQTPVMSGCSSWVICDSKSRPGLKYYFNTVSGETVWNLNDKDQIEKAKRHTQMLYTKLGTVPELPEPKDQPPLEAQRSFNLPIINQMSNFCNMLNMGSRTYNGNVWANPPAVVQQPQFVLVPAVTPMMNPSMGNNSLHPTLGLPFTYQNYGNYSSPYDNSNHRNVPNNKSRGRTFSRKQDQNSTNYRQGGDLRQKLGRKRSLSETRPACKREYFNSNNSEDNPPENEATEDMKKRFRLNSLKLDESYVVVDKDILLNEFVFFDNLVSNDRNFRLVVPYYVMSELKRRARNNGEVRVRRIVRFLSQKIESHVVYLGEEIEGNSCQNENKTFITCQKLVEDNDTNVILVSNESEMRKFSGTNEKIEIMSMNNFKDVLSYNKVRFLSPSARAIKIVIPNNIEHVRTDDISIGEEIEIEKGENHVEGDELNSSFEEYNETNVETEVPNIEPKETSLQCLPSPSFKRTVDTAVQTEIDQEINTTNCISSDTNVEVDTVMRNENGTKKREIRLNRHNPMKKIRIEEPEDKKQFKWRKNRGSINNKQIQATSNVSSPTKNIVIMKAAKDTIPNTAEADANITESKKMKTNSLTYTEKSFATQKLNSNKSSVVDREQAKTANLVTEKDTMIHKEVLRQTSTETWVESVLKSKSETDKDSKCSSHKSVNDTNSSNSTQVKKVNSDVQKVPTKPLKKKIVLKNVKLFTISGNMEEALKMRSDEWMSRFVQIMEEILKEKLQENPPFESCEYPAPWNLHEAAKCIIKKYSNYFNVVDAANKLSFILYKISDEKGTIQLSLQPSEFMEMYSYGVYLVENLLDVSMNCEDLHAAKKLLDDLLYDIQNANTENNCSDIFHDDPNESFVENTTSTDITESDFRPGPQQSTPKKKSQNDCARKTNLKKKLKPELLYNLRSDRGSGKKTSEAPEVCQNVSPIVQDKKSNFLSNLKLITRTISSSSTVTSPAYSNLTERSSVKSPAAAATRFISENRDNNIEKRVKSPVATAINVICKKHENNTEKPASPLTVSYKVTGKEHENGIEEPVKSPLAVTSKVASNDNFVRETVKSPITMITRVIGNDNPGNDIEEITTKNVDNTNRVNKTKEPFKSPLIIATKVASRKQENNIKEFDKNCEEIVSSSGQPSFVRNFQVYPEFEARIKKARRILAHDYDDSYLDDGNCDDNAFDFNMSQYFNLKKCFSKEFQNTLKNVAGFDANSNKKEFNKFALSVGNFQLRSIQETFAEVREMLSVTKSDPSKRDELKMMTMKMVPRITNIYNSLTTILKDNNHDNIKELLRDVDAHSEDQEMFCLKYRKMVAKFRGQACIIIKYLQRILCTT